MMVKQKVSRRWGMGTCDALYTPGASAQQQLSGQLRALIVHDVMGNSSSGPLGPNPEKMLTIIGVSIGGFIALFCCTMGLIRCLCGDVDCGDGDGGTSSEFEGHSSSGGGGGGSGEGGDGG